MLNRANSQAAMINARVEPMMLTFVALSVPNEPPTLQLLYST